MAEKVLNLCKHCKESPVMTRRKRKFTECYPCRAERITSELKCRKVRRELGERIGKVIQYYLDGWRCGYILKLGRFAASVQPIGARGSTAPDIISVALVDIQPAESARLGTLEDYAKTLPPGDRGIARMLKASVQQTETSTEREQPKKLNAAPSAPRTKHGPFDDAEAVRMYQAGSKISDIVVVLKGERAAGHTGNLVRAALRAAGVYKEPTK